MKDGSCSHSMLTAPGSLVKLTVPGATIEVEGVGTADMIQLARRAQVDSVHSELEVRF